MKKRTLVILSGAGISRESGIKTFRDYDGLWEGYDVAEVASPNGWIKNPALVLDFYNARRRQLFEVMPNVAHFALKALEQHFHVEIVTQNVDNLHEQAGSENILHLHGELLRARSTGPGAESYPCLTDIQLGDTCPKGYQLRPDIVWFGEEVTELEKAADICAQADIMLIIGTSLAVYPANTLMHYTPKHCEIYVIDPGNPEWNSNRKAFYIQEPATVGVPALVAELIENHTK